jgi:hypothetical protein
LAGAGGSVFAGRFMVGWCHSRPSAQLGSGREPGHVGAGLCPDRLGHLSAHAGMVSSSAALEQAKPVGHLVVETGDGDVKEVDVSRMTAMSVFRPGTFLTCPAFTNHNSPKRPSSG